jgi:Ferritin-like
LPHRRLLTRREEYNLDKKSRYGHRCSVPEAALPPRALAELYRPMGERTMDLGARTGSAGDHPDDPAKAAHINFHEEDEWIRRYGKRPDMTWRDHLSMLLSFGATVEHCLMVQYLYAAYSLHADINDEKRRRLVEEWRASILAVAKEEMGHLLTVQNLRLLLGSQVELGRDSSPWAQEYYPYPFSLEPFSLLSLSCFVYAEAPELDDPQSKLTDRQRDVLEKEIIPRLRKNFGSSFDADVHHVGKLYREIIDLISNEQRIPESLFDDSSYEFQASWDEWGRGHKAPPRQLDAEGNLLDDQPVADGRNPAEHRKPPDDAVVQIDRMATRADAIKALRALAVQGEAPHLRNPLLPDSKDEISHFDRFLEIYDQFKKELAEEPGWSPAAGIPANPTVRDDFASAVASPTAHGQPPARVNAKAAAVNYTPIEATSAKHLAEIFNQRYRLLLNYLAHSFRISRSQRVDRPNLHAMIMHRVFGEMYNLKTIAGLLVRLPLKDGSDKERAAPPFELPYSLILPDRDVDIWRRHENLLASSQQMCMRLFADASPSTSKHPDAAKVQGELARTGADAYLHTLFQLDGQARDWMKKIIAAEA